MKSPSLVGVVLAFVVLAVVFRVLEGLWPALRQQPHWRRDSPTDLAYWFFTPFVSKAITRVAIVAVVVFLAWRAGVPLDHDHVHAFVVHQRRSSPLPPLAQAFAIVVIGDFVGYWMHRLFHGRGLWRFHAVHHGSTQVDWLSSVRLHPVNEVGAKLAQSIPLFLMGFDYTLLAAYVPFLTFYAILLHANVPWTFGPLRYVVASPSFHRWHHTSQEEGLDKNFAGLLPMWDLLFGTFYMPRGRQPEAFGIHGETIPPGIVGQLVYPFRARA
jgi:sterol desaturase/sphingolipid hydroxylase (fatty acid hydroxylase superfamily)